MIPICFVNAPKNTRLLHDFLVWPSNYFPLGFAHIRGTAGEEHKEPYFVSNQVNGELLKANGGWLLISSLTQYNCF